MCTRNRQGIRRMRRRNRVLRLALLLAEATLACRARAASIPVDTTGAPAHAGTDHAAMHHDMAGMDMEDHEHAMSGAYGPYPMTREASGTSWQPDAARHAGAHLMRGAWTLMLHGHVDAVYDDQGGARGDEQFMSDNMGMAM